MVIPEDRTRHLGACFLLVIVVWCATGPAVAGGDISVRISGDGVVERGNDTVYVWQSGRPAVDVRFSGYDRAVDSVCLANAWAFGENRTVTCRRPSAVSNDTPGVSFGTGEWYAPAPGRHRLTVTLRQGESKLAVRRLMLVVLRPDGDIDRDGLSNRLEVKRGTNLTHPDTDGDGVTDGAEVERDSDPTTPDDVTFPNGSVDIVQAQAGAERSSSVPHDGERWLVGPPDDVAVLALGLVAVVAVGGLIGWRRRRAGNEAGELGGSTETTRSADLTSDQQHVVRLLTAHGDRLRQSVIVEKSGWSKSKVSRLLSDLESTGVIEKVNVGRENVVVLTVEDEPQLDDGA